MKFYARIIIFTASILLLFAACGKTETAKSDTSDYSQELRSSIGALQTVYANFRRESTASTNADELIAAIKHFEKDFRPALEGVDAIMKKYPQIEDEEQRSKEAGDLIESVEQESLIVSGIISKIQSEDYADNEAVLDAVESLMESVGIYQAADIED